MTKGEAQQECKLCGCLIFEWELAEDGAYFGCVYCEKTDELNYR